MKRPNLTKLVQSGVDPDEIDDLFDDEEEAPRLKEPEKRRTRMNTGRNASYDRSKRAIPKETKES